MYKKKIINKNPKSINNRSCLGPCYYPETYINHPIFLKDFYDSNNPTCPTQIYKTKDEITGKEVEKYFDVCEKPTHKEDIMNQQSNFSASFSGFTKDYFLSNYYNILSFDDAIEWYSNNIFLPIDSIIRIINASLNVFGNDIDYFNNIFVDFYILYIKEKQMKYIYKNIFQNIGIINDDVLIIKENNNKLNYDDYSIERINYIYEKFINNNEIKKFLIKFLSEKSKFDEYNDVLYFMTNNFILYIKNYIILITK